MPATSAMPSRGRPTLVSTMDNMMSPAPGTPAVPMEAKVAVSTIIQLLGEAKVEAIDLSDEHGAYPLV